MTPISLPSTSVFSALPTGAGAVVTINIEIQNLGPVTGAETSAQLTGALVDALDHAFGKKVTIARQNAGKAVLS